MSCKNALQMVRTFAELPVQVAQEIPDFFYLAVTYGMMVLAQMIMQPHAFSAVVDVDLADVLDVFQQASSHGQTASLGRMKAFEYTIGKLSEMLDNHEGAGVAAGSGSMQLSSIQSFYENWMAPTLDNVFSEMMPNFFLDGGLE